ncbi:MAG: RnfABCDGE type electron transport complex subunit C [Pseudomonadota bacterium]
MAKSDEQLMKPKRFRRGLDLGPGGPWAAAAIQDMPAPKRLYVPLRQHLGSDCTPKVSQGDHVLMGQLLGESADPLSAPVHSPVSGEVTAVGTHVDPFGRMTPTVTIVNDGKDEWESHPESDPEFLKKKVSAMIRAVRVSGVVNPSTGRPVHSQLAPPERPKAYIFLVGIPVLKPVELLVVSALDSEPVIAGNRRLFLEKAADVRDGIKLVKKIVGAKKAVLVVDDELAGRKDFDRRAAGEEAVLSIIENRYPVAREELLTTALTGRELPWPDGEPRDVEVLVLGVEVILGILEAVRGGRPQIDRVVTVSGKNVFPQNIRARIGTPLNDLLAFAGGSLEGAAKVVSGGMMSGYAQFSGTAPVTKQTTGFRLLADKDLVKFSEHLCIKCGRCVEVCPMRLLPNVITNFCEFGFFAEAEGAELFKCIECGCCAYVCPAKRPLVHYVKHGKAEVTAKRTAR